MSQDQHTGGHTAGPWRVVSDTRSNGNGGQGYPNSDASPILLISGPKGLPIISRRGIARPSRADGKANALLMAAAPDLLAVVMRMNAQGGHGLGEHEEMRAAIAKATGAA